MKNSLKSSLKHLAKIALATCCLSMTVQAADEGKFGLNEENTAAARQTLAAVRKQLDAAVRTVESTIYPNLVTYGINTTMPAASSSLLMNYADGSGTLSSSLSGTFGTGLNQNPYISQLAIFSRGLQVHMKFATSTFAGDNTSSKIPIFEPFIGKRVVLVPVFSIKYDGTTATSKLVVKDQEIANWECLTDADSGVSTNATTIAEGMRSVVSMGGGVLGNCQYITTTNMDAIYYTNVMQ